MYRHGLKDHDAWKKNRNCHLYSPRYMSMNSIDLLILLRELSHRQIKGLLTLCSKKRLKRTVRINQTLTVHCLNTTLHRVNDESISPLNYKDDKIIIRHLYFVQSELCEIETPCHNPYIKWFAGAACRICYPLFYSRMLSYVPMLVTLNRC